MKHSGGEERSANVESGQSSASQIRVRVRTQDPLPPAQFLLPVARDETLAQLRFRIHTVLLEHYAGGAQWDPAALALEVDGFRLWEERVALLLRDGETLTVLCVEEGPPQKRIRQQEPDDVMREANRIAQTMRAEVGPRGERKVSWHMQGEPPFPMPPPGMPGLAGGVAKALSAFESRKRQRQIEPTDGDEESPEDGTARPLGADSDSGVIQGVEVHADSASDANGKAQATYTVTAGDATDTSSSNTDPTSVGSDDSSSDEASSDKSSSDNSSSDTSTESESTESADSDSDTNQDTQTTSSSDDEHSVQQSATEETTSSDTDTSTVSSDDSSESSESGDDSSDSDSSSSSSSVSTASSAPSTAPTTFESTQWVPPGQGKASTKRKNLRRRERQRQQAAETGAPVGMVAEASALRPTGALPPGDGELDILASTGGAVPDSETKPAAATPLENIAQRMLAHTTVGYRRRRNRQAAAPVSSMPLAEPGPTQHPERAVGQALQRQFMRTPPPSMRPREEIPEGISISSTDCAAWYEQQWQDEWDAQDYEAEDPATCMYLEMQRQVRTALAEEKRAEELAEAAAPQGQNRLDEDAAEAALRAALPREFGSTRVKASLDADQPDTAVDAPPMHATELPVAEEQMDLDYGPPEEAPARSKGAPIAPAETTSERGISAPPEAVPERPRRSLLGAIRDAVFHRH